MFFYPPTMPFSKPTTKPTSKSSSQVPKVENVASGIIKGPPIREILINNQNENNVIISRDNYNNSIQYLNQLNNIR